MSLTVEAGELVAVMGLALPRELDGVGVRADRNLALAALVGIPLLAGASAFAFTRPGVGLQRRLA